MKRIFITLILTLTLWSTYGQGDYYAGKESITYNGVEWKITYDEDLEAYSVRRVISKYNYSPTRYKNGQKVPPDIIEYPRPEPPTSTIRTEAAKAFAGHHADLKGAMLHVGYWVNTMTGKVEDMEFVFGTEWPFKEYDISFFDNLYQRVRKRIKFAKPYSSSAINDYDGFVQMGSIVIFENMTPYTPPYPI